MKLKKVLGFLPIKKFRHPDPVVPVVRLSGAIMERGIGRKGLSLAGLDKTLEEAFETDDAVAVALAINSPGGSPVQSDLIARRIKELSKEKELPVIAFVEDVAASGGYWLACAASEIVAAPASVVGSIGVISSGFGMVELLNKMGIERRLHTSGDRKGMLDPFSPEKPDHVKRLKALQSEIHEIFKEHVRQSRGDKLKGAEKDLFSGEFWTATKGLELGLVDELGDMYSVLKERFGHNVKLKPMERPKSWIQRRLNLGEEVGQDLKNGWADGLIGAVEERELWGRFGL